LLNLVSVLTQLLAITHFLFFETEERYQSDYHTEAYNPNDNYGNYCAYFNLDVHSKHPASNSTKHHQDYIESEIAFPRDVQLFYPVDLGDCELLGLKGLFTQLV